MTIFLRITYLITFFLIVYPKGVYSQETTEEQKDDRMEELTDLSLEELMDLKIVSASKKSESVFDAPVSSYSITRNEIAKSGVTSIPEALRLCPGVIVRETTNGNYEVYIRGFDNLTRFTIPNETTNTLMLVMIDDRPVFNYNNGGTIWESLPIDLIDVDRIEIVRGPSSPLFGPNAVTGVINIITHRPEEEGVYVSANIQAGSSNSLIGNIAAGSKLNDKLDFIVSLNYQGRDRHDDLYYDNDSAVFVDGGPTSLPSVITQNLFIPGFAALYANQFPDPALAVEKYGVNGFLNYTSDDLELSFTAGFQDAESQKPYSTDISVISFSRYDSWHTNLNTKYKGLGLRFSYLNGFNDLKVNGLEAIFKYDLSVTDVLLDYTWHVNEQLNISPSFNYQQAVYDDSAYETGPVPGIFGVLNGEAEVNSLAGGLKVEFLPIDNLRLIAGARVDKFNIPDDTYISYQFATTYKTSDKVLFRAVHSRSNSGAFLANTQLNSRFNRVNPDLSVTRLKALGTDTLELPINIMTEIGVRVKLVDNIQAEISLFTQKIEGFSSITLLSIPIFDPTDNRLIFAKYDNLPTEATQNGVTVAINYVASPRLHFKPFFTFQTTESKNVAQRVNSVITGLFDGDHESTPSFFGGLYANYSISPKLNFNLNGYYMGSNTQYNVDDPGISRPEKDIDSKLILNAKLSYNIWDQLNAYINARNLTNNDSREYYAADRNGSFILGGISYNF